CRNCGYDFSLIESAAVPELPIRAQPQTLGPLDDLSLIDTAAASGPVRAQAQASRLPLFTASALDDEPLIKKPSAPRPPLAVRRATPRLQGLDLALEHDVSAPPRMPAMSQLAAMSAETVTSLDEENRLDAALGARLAAVTMDLLILASTDLVVVYLTLQICGIGMSELSILPKWPLLAFLLVQNSAYLVVFTAGGQTLGKMAVGIKVVPHRRHSSVDLADALIRELVWLALAVPAGLGFLTIFSRDRRGLHDRFAGTRVVR